MATAYKSQGTAVGTQTSGADCNPTCPAVVDANDILLGFVYFEGTADTPVTPAGWTLLDGPRVVETTIGRMWVFGKLAVGTEDGAAISFGTQATANMRAARIHSYSGWVSGTITDVVLGFAFLSHATDPQMPSVTTTVANSLAVAHVIQNDNNALAAATGEVGGDWVESVAEAVFALTPGCVLQAQHATMASIGTISGGAVAATNDPSGVIAFEVRPNAPAVVDADAEVSWAEVEVPSAVVDADAEVSWAEFEVPISADAEIAWTEFEVPTADADAEVAWAELEVPTADAAAEIAWAEVEVPTANSDAEVAYAALETPSGPTEGRYYATGSVTGALSGWTSVPLSDSAVNQKAGSGMRFKLRLAVSKTGGDTTGYLFRARLLLDGIETARVLHAREATDGRESPFEEDWTDAVTEYMMELSEDTEHSASVDVEALSPGGAVTATVYVWGMGHE